MAAILNPVGTLSWTDTAAYTDGTPFTAANFKAYELGVSDTANGAVTPLLVLPVNFGVGTAPMPDAIKGVVGRSQFLALRTIDVRDQTSAWSGRVEVRYTGVPLAPSALAVA